VCILTVSLVELFLAEFSFVTLFEMIATDLIEHENLIFFFLYVA
jgi:hypothetical protein